MLPSFRSGTTFMMSLALACAGACAWEWIPSRDKGAQIDNVYYGIDDEPREDGWQGSPVLKVALEGAGRFRYNFSDREDALAIYQSLVQAKAGNLPVILMADTSTHIFEAVVIGNVDPDFPLAARGAVLSTKARTAGRIGYDPLGRVRSAAGPAPVPILARPAPAEASRRPAR